MISNAQFVSATLADGNLSPDVLPLFEKAKTDGTAGWANLGFTALNNLFLPMLMNKFAKQVMFDITGSWVNPLSKHMLRDSGVYGEYTELDSVNSNPEESVFDPVLDDTTKNNPFNYFGKTELNSDVIGIAFYKVWYVTISLKEMRKACISDGGIYNTLNSLIIGSLDKKADIYLYNYSLDLLTKIPLNYAIETPSIADNGDTKAKLSYARIIQLINKMKTPKTIFNERGYISTTDPKYAYLVFNTHVDSVYKVSIIASLFNSDKINVGNQIGSVESLDLSSIEDPGVLGYLLDNDKIREEIYYTDTIPQIIATNATTNYFHHLEIKAGMNRALNGVKLTSVVSAPVVTKDTTATTLTATTATVNAKIYYSVGTSTDLTEYTAPITYTAGTTYKFVAKAVEDDGTAIATIPVSATTSITA